MIVFDYFLIMTTKPNKFMAQKKTFSVHFYTEDQLVRNYKKTIGDHVMLYHATVVSRYTRQRAYPQQSFAMCCGWQQDLKHTVNGC